MIGLVRQFHPHQNIARHEAALCRHFFTAAHLNYLFRRNQNLFDLLFHIGIDSRLANGLCDLLFVVRQNTYGIPSFCHFMALHLARAWPENSNVNAFGAK